MKKFAALLLTFILMLCMVACTDTPDDSNGNGDNSSDGKPPVISGPLVDIEPD